MLGLNASLSGLARIAAPSAAGALIAVFGIRYCFIPNALTSAINLFGLYFLTRNLSHHGGRRFSPVANLIEGLRIVARNSEVAVLLIVLFCVTTIPLSFNVILPVLVDETLGGGATAFGTLMSCMGIGALIASLIISARGMTVYATLGCAVGIGVIQSALYFQSQMIAVALLIVAAGGCAVGLIVGTNAIILTRTDRAVHGRIGGLFSYIIGAIGPLGSVVMGVIVAQGGARAGLAIGAAIATSSGAIGLLALRRGQARGN